MVDLSAVDVTRAQMPRLFVPGGATPHRTQSPRPDLAVDDDGQVHFAIHPGPVEKNRNVLGRRSRDPLSTRLSTAYRSLDAYGHLREHPPDEPNRALVSRTNRLGS